MCFISVVVTTYNWPSALHLSLLSLFAQTDQHFEIVIADDGSHPENLATNRLACAKSPVPIQYVYHEDQGFRAAAIRNKAILQCKGDYVIFLDGDCIICPHFISTHRKLAETGYFVPGNRILLNQTYTNEVIQQGIELHHSSYRYFLLLRLQNKINRLLPLLTLPLGILRKIRPHKWQQAMTCNLGVWKSDLLRVNGFDEAFSGWGFEDSDLVVRLLHAGVQRKEGRFAVPVLHLWHPQNDRRQHDNNYQRLMARIQQHTCIVAEQGISQYVD